jgi:hypothetical protein
VFGNAAAVRSIALFIGCRDTTQKEAVFANSTRRWAEKVRALRLVIRSPRPPLMRGLRAESGCRQSGSYQARVP